MSQAAQAARNKGRSVTAYGRQLQARTTSLPPPIKLRGEEPKKCTKDNSFALTLKSSPGKETSATYTTSIPFLENGDTVMQVIQWKENFDKAIAGQELANPTNKYDMARNLMKGKPLETFNTMATSLGKPTNIHFQKSVTGVVESMMPRRALQAEKSYMKRGCPKPADMLFREYNTKLDNLNNQLPKLPPFLESNKISAEDMLEIKTFNIPKPWKSAMIIQNFIPEQHTPEEIMEFCEHLEFATTNYQTLFYGQQHVNTHNTHQPKQNIQGAIKKRRRAASNHTRNTTKYCNLHGWCAHTTEACRDLDENGKPIERASKKPRRSDNFSKSKAYSGKYNKYSCWRYTID